MTTASAYTRDEPDACRRLAAAARYHGHTFAVTRRTTPRGEVVRLVVVDGWGSGARVEFVWCSVEGGPWHADDGDDPAARDRVSDLGLAVRR